MCVYLEEAGTMGGTLSTSRANTLERSTWS
jgi:hypothetical protein